MKKLLKRMIITLSVLLIASIILFINKENKANTYTPLLTPNLQPIRLNQYVETLSNSIKTYDIDIPENFELVQENNQLALYLEKETLAIAIRVKDNGYVWFSYDVTADLSTYSDSMIAQIKSGIMVFTYNKYTPGRRTVFDEGVEITYDYTNGIKATVDFTDIMIKFVVDIYLDKGELIIEIPSDSIEEYNPKLWETGNTDISLHKIALFPYLGSTDQKENGYIIMPDGTGAIVSLTNEPKYKLNYSQPVYGKDYGYEDNPKLPEEKSEELELNTVKPLERVSMPVYGIIHEVGNNGMLAIAEKGASYAFYNYVSKDLTTDFYQSYFEYYYRVTYKQYQSRTDTSMHILGFQPEPNQYDLKQRFIFLTGEDANYVGAAKSYRQFLEENEQLPNKTTHQEHYSTKIDIIGNEVEKGIFRLKNVKTATYEDTVQLMKQLQTDGYHNLDVTFKTFDQSESSYRFDLFRQLGGKDDFQDMLNYFEDNQIDFSYFVDYINTFKEGSESASRMSRSVLSRYNYTYLYYIHYMNNPRFLNQLLKEDIEDYHDAGIDALSLSGFEKALFTHNDDKTIRYRNDNINYITSGMDTLANENIQTNFYHPDAYLYPYVSKYYEMPYSSSEQMFIDATIPFLQLVLSGHMELYSPYLNFTSNDDTILLRLLEYGLSPSYIMTTKDVYELKYTNSSHIYVSQYDALKNRMKKYDAILREGLNKINGVELINHTLIDEGISRSEYANGTVIIVNYTNQDYDLNGVTISAKGYDVL